jgi:hypothetical protein
MMVLCCMRMQACTATCDLPQPTGASPPQAVCTRDCEFDFFCTPPLWKVDGGACYPAAVGKSGTLFAGSEPRRGACKALHPAPAAGPGVLSVL